ncbi:unnamed protein product (macronuclear) [Paramecium tetraurelia]|uniref:Uncharacterized protein n=1 Tax=Paramecium tetraurelia TaxID=5888 RepID=A0DFL7_PARTE|nr:uncharacterized protein GSPATT00016647001 [Paramecium tetraurelia]CAK81834.1 unnamed protein product [Paramecium tetraurelia]|eukprot:XP_001449231.1 hypothetical protein (macronuclear) [Paramecium tetraurelia strain d4-2]
MKAILLLVLLTTGLASESFLSTQQEIQEMELTGSHLSDFLMGYAAGVGVLDAMPDILHCVGTVTEIQNDFKLAIEDLKSKNVELVVRGVQILAKIFDGVASNCGNTAIDGVKSYMNVVAMIKAKGFIKRGWIYIGKNFEEVVLDLQTYFFLGDDDWLLKGAYIGDIVKIFFTGIPNDK